MAARNETVQIPANTWTRVTLDPVGGLRLQNKSGQYIEVSATTGTTAPSDLSGSVQVNPYDGFRADVPLSSLFPGVITSTGHVWVYAGISVSVSVSHA